MTKIEKLEELIVEEGLTDDNFAEFQRLLKRVRDNYNKRQHCYITAIKFPPENAAQAVKLIEYGLSAFPGDWLSTYTSYSYIGEIYSRAGEYSKAYDAYLSAMEALADDEKVQRGLLSGKLMWMRLHMDAFQYSQEFEKYYLIFAQTDSFLLDFIDNDFKLSVAKLVSALHNNFTDDALIAYNHALELTNEGYAGKLQPVLSQHKYTDKLHATPESIEFLKSFSKHLG